MTGKEGEDWTGGYISDWAKDQFGRRSLTTGDRDFKIGVPRKGESLGSTLQRDLITLRAELPEATADLIVTYKWFPKLPLLSKFEEEEGTSFREPRYDRVTGAVFTTRSQTPSLVFTDEGKKAFREPESLIILRKPRHIENVDLTQIPKSWSVKMIVPQENWGGLTSAGRQVDEVRDAHKGRGVELARVEDLYDWANRLEQKYARGDSSPEVLSRFRDDLFQILASQGIIASRIADFEGLEDDLLRALLPDRLGRRNSSASRLRIFKIMRNLTSR